VPDPVPADEPPSKLDEWFGSPEKLFWYLTAGAGGVTAAAGGLAMVRRFIGSIFEGGSDEE